MKVSDKNIRRKAALAACLRAAIHRELTSVAQLAKLTGNSKKTIHRWMSDDAACVVCQPRYADLCTIEEHLPRVFDLVLVAMCPVRTFTHGDVRPVDADANGRIDGADVLLLEAMNSNVAEARSMALIGGSGLGRYTTDRALAIVAAKQQEILHDQTVIATARAAAMC